MEDQNYWVVIPTKLFFSKKGNKDSSGLYALISSLTKKEGYCYASNRFLADKVGVSVPSIVRWLKELKDLNYIHIDYNKEEVNNDKRKIFINGEGGVCSNFEQTGLIKKGVKRLDGSNQKGGVLITNSNKDSKIDAHNISSNIDTEIIPTNENGEPLKAKHTKKVNAWIDDQVSMVKDAFISECAKLGWKGIRVSKSDEISIKRNVGKLGTKMVVDILKAYVKIENAQWMFISAALSDVNINRTICSVKPEAKDRAYVQNGQGEWIEQN